jgi:hypothetical protein
LAALALTACAASAPPSSAPAVAAPVAAVSPDGPSSDRRAGTEANTDVGTDAGLVADVAGRPPIAAAVLAFEPKPECRAATMELEMLVKTCACPPDLVSLIRGDPPSPCHRFARTDDERVLGDVVVRVVAPANVATGSHVELDVRAENASAEPVRLAFADEVATELLVIDAVGRAIEPILDPSCKEGGALRSVPLAPVILAPGAFVHTHERFDAVRWRGVGAGWQPPGAKHPKLDRARRTLEEIEPTGPCEDVVERPLPAGDYTLEVRLPFAPQTLRSKLVGRARVHVR